MNKKDIASQTAVKIHAFAALVQEQVTNELRRDGLACEANLVNARTHVHVGKKYARVDIGSSGRYMIDLAIGGIFGIKAYGVIHRGHDYGTLDTTGNYYWGGYRAIPSRPNLD